MKVWGGRRRVWGVKDAEMIEEAIRNQILKPTGELTKANLKKVKVLYLFSKQLTEVPEDLEKLTKLRELDLSWNQLTDVKGLEKLTQLTILNLDQNQLTDVTGLEKLTQLEELNLMNNPDLPFVKIAELQKALPKCSIIHNAKLSAKESAKVIEAAIRKAAKKFTGELTKADLEKVTELPIFEEKLTNIKGLEKLTQLKKLDLSGKELTDVKGLEKLTQLEEL